MAEICLKTRSNSYCSASPITDCSCSPDPRFSDPFPPLPERLDQASLGKDIEAVIKSARGRIPIGKFRIIAQIARLILLEKVSVDDCFVITALDCESEEVPVRNGTAA